MNSNKTVETLSGEHVSDFLTGAQRGDDDNKPQFTEVFPETISIPFKLQDGYGVRMKYNGQEFLVAREEPINFALPWIETDTSMIPNLALNRLGGLFWRGAQKYSRDNWKKGMNIKRTFMSLMRHVVYYWAGDTKEDHLSAIMWNALVIMWTEKEIADGKLPKELADLGPMLYRKE